MQIDIAHANALIAELQRQRNGALDQAAVFAGRVSELEAALKEAQGQTQPAAAQPDAEAA